MNGKAITAGILVAIVAAAAYGFGVSHGGAKAREHEKISVQYLNSVIDQAYLCAPQCKPSPEPETGY